MSESILTSIKKNLLIAEEYTMFDDVVTLYINSALADLAQLGLGPAEGFAIESKSDTWDDFLTTTPKLFNSVKTLVTLKVKLLFDPPNTSYVLAAFQQQITKFEFMLNVQREHTDWIDPTTSPSETGTIDGGVPGPEAPEFVFDGGGV